jgi:hypothetical protein
VYVSGEGVDKVCEGGCEWKRGWIECVNRGGCEWKRGVNRVCE